MSDLQQLRRKLRIYFATNVYISLNKVDTAYRQCIAEKYQLTNDISNANVVIYHNVHQNEVLVNQAKLRRRFPVYRIGYCVNEAIPLPPFDLERFPYYDELWTASYHCYQSWLHLHPNVHLLPHICPPAQVYPPAQAYQILQQRFADLAKILQAQRHLFCFFNIADLTHKRKNVPLLLNVFERLRLYYPQTMLLQKSSGCNHFSSNLTGKPHHQIEWRNHVLHIDGSSDFTESELTALYSLAHAYVSPHSCEGWGLPLSEAMMLGVPVVATRFSGNLMFMTEDNSYLVQAHPKIDNKPLGPLRSLCRQTITSLVNPLSLEKKMMQVIRERNLEVCRRKITQAKLALAPFSPQSVGELLDQHLLRIADKLNHMNVPVA